MSDKEQEIKLGVIPSDLAMEKAVRTLRHLDTFIVEDVIRELKKHSGPSLDTQKTASRVEDFLGGLVCIGILHGAGSEYCANFNSLFWLMPSSDCL